MKRDWKTKEEYLSWEYVFPIERRFKNRFTVYGTDCYILSIFNCCRSLHKEVEAEHEHESEPEEEEKENANAEATRGEGESSPELNFMFINGC